MPPLVSILIPAYNAEKWIADTIASALAQTHALGFYERLGFVAFGDEFDDAGIPHRDMVLEL